MQRTVHILWVLFAMEASGEVLILTILNMKGYDILLFLYTIVVLLYKEIETEYSTFQQRNVTCDLTRQKYILKLAV